MKINNQLVAGRLRQIAAAETATRKKLLPATSGPKILITGGAGNVGSNLALALKAQGFQTFAFDNLYSGHPEALEISSTPLYEDDLTDFARINEVLKIIQPDLVIHAAAYIEVGESNQNPDKYFLGNVTGGYNLFRAMRDLGLANLVFSNTAAVYQSSDQALTEEALKNPNSFYGLSKKILGEILEQGVAFPGLRTTSLHYFNVFGAPEWSFLREDHGLGSESHLIPRILQVALYNLVERFGLEVPGFNSGEICALYSQAGRTELTIFSKQYPTPDGTCIRDYISLETMIFFHLLAIKRLLAGGQEKHYEAFNLGTKTGNSVLSVINAAENVVRQELGLPVLAEADLKDINCPQRIIPLKIGDVRPGDAAFLVADPEKAIRELAHGAEVPGTSLEENIRRAFWSMLYRPLGY